MNDGMVQLNKVTKAYGSFQLDCSMEVQPGMATGFVGANGAGKTTVFNLLTGVYKPTSGEFFLNGKSLLGKGQTAINRAGIARTFQNIRIFNDMTVIRNVMVG